jgi:hypothetical protein
VLSQMVASMFPAFISRFVISSESVPPTWFLVAGSGEMSSLRIEGPGVGSYRAPFSSKVLTVHCKLDILSWYIPMSFSSSERIFSLSGLAATRDFNNSLELRFLHLF